MSKALTNAPKRATGKPFGKDNPGKPFLPGNPGGPGNPHICEVQRKIKMLHEEVNPEKYRALVRRLLDIGINGEESNAIKAADVILSRCGVKSEVEKTNETIADASERVNDFFTRLIAITG
jgi:hypothetical protein